MGIVSSLAKAKLRLQVLTKSNAGNIYVAAALPLYPRAHTQQFQEFSFSEILDAGRKVYFQIELCELPVQAPDLSALESIRISWDDHEELVLDELVCEKQQREDVETLLIRPADQIYVKLPDSVDVVAFTLEWTFNTGEELCVTSRHIALAYADKTQAADYAAMVDELVNASDPEIMSWMYAHSSADNTFSNLFGTSAQEGFGGTMIEALKSATQLLDALDFNLGYMRSHAKSKISYSSKMTDFRHVREVSRFELDWIAQHLERLHPIDGNKGIRAGSNNYTAHEIMSMGKVKTRDFYENRVILGMLTEFLRYISSSYFVLTNKITEMETDYAKLTKLSKKQNNRFVPAAFTVMRYLKANLEVLYGLVKLRKRALTLDALYKTIFQGVTPLVEAHIRYTSTFQQIPSYRDIYEAFSYWRQHRRINIARELVIPELLKKDSFYEHFCLYKLLYAIKEAGFVLAADVSEAVLLRTYKTGITHVDNCSASNVYHFKQGSSQLTLFYQPPIPSHGSLQGGCGLYRISGTALSRATLPQSIIYSPDYVLKHVNADGVVRYVVLDAKNKDMMGLFKVKTNFSLSMKNSASFWSLLEKYLLDSKGSDGEIISFYGLFSKKQPSVPKRIDLQIGSIAKRLGTYTSGVVHVSSGENDIAEVMRDLDIFSNIKTHVNTGKIKYAKASQ